MSIAAAIATVVLLAVVLLIVSAPLRRARRAAGPEQEELAELEAAREAKYREIRDAELDYRTGKLSREDFDAVDRTLRAEAIGILDRIERLREPESEPQQRR